MPIGLRTVVIGAGVSGLTTAIELLNKEFIDVTIMSDKFHPDITSSVAAAVWVPYKVAPLDKAKRWCEHSLVHLDELSKDDSTGVSWIDCTRLFTERDVALDWIDLSLPGKTPDYIPDGYETIITTKIPLMDVTIYLPWLMSKFELLGGHFERKLVTSLDEISEDFDLVINCSGLGSRSLVKDASIHSVSGQIIICDLPKNLSYSIACDEDPNKLTYVVPRKKSKTLVIGGTAIINDENPLVEEEITERILERAKTICPAVRAIDTSSIKSIKGFRPVRESVRVEIEELQNGKPVIHNYGHGGGGYAISWGCASEVSDLACGISYTHTRISKL